MLYSEGLEGGGLKGIAQALWGRIPSTMGEAHGVLAGVRERYSAPLDALEELKRLAKAQLRKLGILTSRVEENIEALHGGVMEGGHQPMLLGGPSLILNKVAYASCLSGLGGGGFVPLLYVADYDGVQPELTVTRVPSPSPRGLLISHPSGQELEGTPIWRLHNPPEAWLKETMERIRGNYRGLLKGEAPQTRDRALMSLDHALTIVRGAYHSTDCVSDWSTKILGSIFNLESDMGVPILQFSTPGTRRLFQQGYELLLSEPNRSRFVEASNRASGLIEQAGYRSSFGRRADDYVPFFLECPSPGCKRTRVELKYLRVQGSPTASVTGRCPSCGEAHEYSFDAGAPDLSDIIGSISPRVDSRQVIVDSVIPVLAHIGGPGETGYYAEVIPAAEALGVPFPVFVRYTRTFYNTPWNEKASRSLREQGYPSLASDELFRAIGRWVEARNEGNREKLWSAHSEIRSSIDKTHSALVDELRSIQSRLGDNKARLRDSVERAPLISEMRKKQALAQEIESYLSSAFGRFSQERFGQEVSWAWLDLAAAAGVSDLMGVFKRVYNEDTPNSSMFYVNL
jgi:hypothetical protein